MGRTNFYSLYFIPIDTSQTVVGVGWVQGRGRGREGEKHSEVVLAHRRFGIRQLKR